MAAAMIDVESEQHIDNVTEMEANNLISKRNCDIYRKKYIILKRKCQLIQLDSEKCLNRLYYVKKAARKTERERRFLMTELDKHHDDYKNATLTLPIEDDSVLQLLSAPATPSLQASQQLASLVSRKQRRKPSSAATRRVGRPRLISEMTSLDEVSMTRPTPRPARRKRAHPHNKPDKIKDPLQPKKPSNAFMMFCQSERQLMQEGVDRAEMSHQEITRQLAKRWNYLSEDNKRTYYSMYQVDKERYQRQMKHYMGNRMPQAAKDKPQKRVRVIKAETNTPPREPTMCNVHTESKKPMDTPRTETPIRVKQEYTPESTKMDAVNYSNGLKQKAPLPEEDPYNFDDD